MTLTTSGSVHVALIKAAALSYQKPFGTGDWPNATQYLADNSERTAIMTSKWFTRAWTLQELLAPNGVQVEGKTSMEFFSRNWQQLVSKLSLSNVVSDNPSVGTQYVEARASIQQVSACESREQLVVKLQELKTLRTA